MGFGIALGGAAQGFRSQQEAALGRRTLDIRESALAQDKSLRERALGLQERSVEFDESQQLRADVQKMVSENAELMDTLIKNAQANGNPPDKIRAGIEDLLSFTQDNMISAGLDPEPLMARINAQIEGPAAPLPTKVGATLEKAREDFAAGRTLTPGQKKLLEQAAKTTSFKAAILGLLGGQEGLEGLEGTTAPPVIVEPPLGSIPAPFAPPPVAAPPPAAPPQVAPAVAPPATARATSATDIGTAATPLPFEPLPGRRIVGLVYTLPSGKLARWIQDQQGQVGWEPLN